MREKIAASLAGLSRAERRVADTVLADPEAALHGTVGQLARAAAVSEPTVVRFCRSIGVDGFPALRIALAQDAVVTTATPRIHARVHPGQRPAQAAGIVVDNAIEALAGLRHTLDGQAVERAALALIRASRVEIWGFGASGAVARDAEHKLFRVCRGVVARTDPHMQAMAAATLDSDAAVLAISHTGRSRELVENAALAARAGATVIGLTTPGSPLAQVATLLVPAVADEDTALYTPMVSRLVHLVLVDALAVGAALLAPPGSEARLARMKAALGPRRIGGGHA